MRAKSLEGAKWIKAGETAVIQGTRISGGFFYLGDFLPRIDRASNENCLIDPRLPVSRTRADISGHYMPYWPSYSTITPWSRKAYLTWLAGSRSDPHSYIGYPFLCLYGLERRLFVDVECDDADDVLGEVRRLLNVYASSGSFQYYGWALLRTCETIGSQRQCLPPLGTSTTRRALRGCNSRHSHHHRRRRTSDETYIAASGTFEMAINPEVFCQKGSCRQSPKGQILRSASFPAPSRNLNCKAASTSSREKPTNIVDQFFEGHRPSLALDQDLLTSIRCETRKTTIVLAGIFSEEDVADKEIAQREEIPAQLDDSYRAVLREIAAQSEWTRQSFDRMTKRYGLLPSSVIERLNAWALDSFDDLLILGDDPILIALELISHAAN